MLAASSIRASITPTWSYLAATWSAILPSCIIISWTNQAHTPQHNIHVHTLLGRLGSAPCLTRKWTISVWPISLATCSELTPSCSGKKRVGGKEMIEQGERKEGGMGGQDRWAVTHLILQVYVSTSFNQSFNNTDMTIPCSNVNCSLAILYIKMVLANQTHIWIYHNTYFHSHWVDIYTSSN